MAATLMSFTIKDSDGDRETHQLFFNDAVTLAQLQTFATAYAPLLDACIDTVVEKCSVSFDLTVPGGIKTDPVANSENQLGAVLSFNTGGRHAWGTRVAGWKPSLFSGKLILQPDTDVDALVDAVHNGLGGTSPVDPQDATILALKKGSKSQTKR